MFGPAWLAYGHSFTVENDGQAMAAYFKASQLMACFKEFGSVSDARFLEMGRRPSRGWRCPCPHPKLTAKQKQHILDRSSALASFGQLTEQLLGRCMMGAGHSRPGGSVPSSGSSCSRRASAFGVEPVQVGSNPIRLQFKIKIYNTFPLLAGAGAAAEGAAAVGDGDHALEAEPGDGQQQGPGAAPGDNTVPDTGRF